MHLVAETDMRFIIEQFWAKQILNVFDIEMENIIWLEDTELEY